MVQSAEAAWTTADYALIISLFSVTLSLAGFVWNIWSKFIYPKPRLRVHISFVLFDDARQQVNFFPAGRPYVDRLDNDFLILPAVRIYVANLGPGEVKLGNPVAARAGRNSPKREGYAQFVEFVKYPFQHPLPPSENKLSSPLKPAEDLELYIETSYEELRELNPTRIGFFDSFGRKHLCSKKDVRHLLSVAKGYADKQGYRTDAA